MLNKIKVTAKISIKFKPQDMNKHIILKLPVHQQKIRQIILNLRTKKIWFLDLKDIFNQQILHPMANFKNQDMCIQSHLHLIPQNQFQGHKVEKKILYKAEI